MVSASIREKADECRSVLSAGACARAHEQLLAVFRAAHANDRYSLVHEYPEFFQGGNHDNCPNTPEYLASAELTLISQTSTTERAALFGLSQAVKPLRSLEIGRARGGSTWILASGCLATEGARFVSIDPNERGGEHFLNEKLRQKLLNQGVTLQDVASPNGIADALKSAGGKFDFVFIDADHSYEAVLADLKGVFPALNTNAYIVLHDANYPGVSDAVADFVSTSGITDCGKIGRDRNESQKNQTYRGKPVTWGGLHLLYHGNPTRKTSFFYSFFSKQR